MGLHRSATLNTAYWLALALDMICTRVPESNGCGLLYGANARVKA